MAFSTLAIVVALSVVATDRVIDKFDYADSAAARLAWVDHGEGGEASAVSVVADGNRNVLQLTVPFSSQPDLNRVYIDRQVNLDLAAVGQFMLDAHLSAPDTYVRMTLYFHSGNGWYGAGGGLSGAQWKTVRFPKASFSAEGKPAGWDKVDGIRIAFWRGPNQDVAVRLRGLANVWHDIVLIVPSEKAQPEYATSVATTARIANLLAKLGLECDTIEDVQLARGALNGRRVVVLPYNPNLSSAPLDTLVTFIEGGGKALVCYQLPSKLGTALGFGKSRYVKQERPGQFAEFRFDDDSIQGLPASVRQASWNITVAKPTGYHARVIGRWFDEDGGATSDAAMLVSDRGAFLSHIILEDDPAGKQQMLAAIMGHFSSVFWKQMAQGKLDHVDRVGHFNNFDELSRFLESADQTEVRRRYQTAVKKTEGAKAALAANTFSKAIDLAGEAHEELVAAYLMAQPSPTTEGRAFWNHSGTGAYEGDWDRTARELEAAGFNMVLPNMLWGGVAHYASDVLPRSDTYKKLGDQIAQCVAAAHKVGLEVHVWKVNYNLSRAPKDFIQKIHREHRNQVSVDGSPRDWLCPSHPDNFQLELASMLEVVRKYPVDGLHFDYIRYPGRDSCYCDGCRERFQADTKLAVTHWPDDCYSGTLREQYADWRCDQITRLVRAVHDQAKKLRPDVKISAAVFNSYPNCRASVAQDWPEWIKAGYLDFVCPMDYTQDDSAFVSLVRDQLKRVGGRIPVYPGIGQWRLPDDRTVGQIYHARKLGAAGFTIFNLNRDSIESVVPAIAAGVGKQKAVPPHRNR